MDRRERVEDLVVALQAALDGRQRELWTAMPGVIQSVSLSKMTCSVQPAVQAMVEKNDGTYETVNMPLLVDVPLHFPSGGGFTLTFPVAKGDECLVVFASRCIDSWWQSGGTSNKPVSYRMHDLSDGFAFAGFRSQVRLVSGISATATQLRADDGSTYVEVGAGAVDIVAPSGVTINGVAFDSSGNVVAPGEGTFNSHTVGGHTHPDPQGGNVGTPTG